MVSTKGRYALRLMIDLALNHDGAYVSLKEISKRQNISVKYLEQIVVNLSKEGLLLSSRGSKGGYRLYKTPKEYTAGEILRATEGTMSPVACLGGESNPCPRQEKCLTLDFWSGLHKVISDYIDSVTLEDLVNQEKAGDYVI